jgi:hypothetical protein
MDEEKLPRAPASTTSLDQILSKNEEENAKQATALAKKSSPHSSYDPSLQRNEDEDGDDVKKPELPEEVADEKPATAPKDTEKVYITGIPLALVTAAVTMVVFLVLLDMSIIATVRNPPPPG